MYKKRTSKMEVLFLLFETSFAGRVRAWSLT